MTEKAIDILVAFIGFTVASGSVMAVKIGSQSIALTNFAYIALIVLYIIYNKAHIYLNKLKIILICFCALITLESLFAYITYTNSLTREGLFLTVKMVGIALGLSLTVNDNQMKKNIEAFFRFFYINAICQMVWSWMERIFYSVGSFKLNEFVFGKILGVETSHELTFIKEGTLRPSGFSWEPANLAIVLVIGYILSKNIILKFLFAVSILISTSATGIALLGLILLIECYNYIFIKKSLKFEKKYLKRYALIFIFGLIFILIVELKSGVIENTVMRFINMFTDNADSSSSRHIAYYFESVQILMNSNVINILFGYGTFMAGHIFSRDLNVYSWLVNTLWNPETDFVTLLIGNGIIGCIFYYFMCFSIFKERLKKDKKYALIILVFVAGGITYIYFRSAWVLLIFAMLCYSDIDSNNFNFETAKPELLEVK